MKFQNKQKISAKIIEFTEQNLSRHVEMLSGIIGPRNLVQYDNLMAAADYIVRVGSDYSQQPQIQQYSCEERRVQNIIFEKRGEAGPEEIIIVGAHYDTVLDSPGADDNGSGVAALLELIRLLQSYDNRRTFRFVAFTLEEPPFFNTEQMGSWRYARQCSLNKDKILAMMSLEMLGYFTDEPMSQEYPIREMLFAYPERGSFIGVVGNRESAKLTNSFSNFLKEAALIKVETLISDAEVPGVDLSDHASFWKFGYPALMVTDTAFFRNPYYHTSKDTADRVNFKKFTNVVHALEFALKRLDRLEL